MYAWVVIPFFHWAGWCYGIHVTKPQTYFICNLHAVPSPLVALPLRKTRTSICGVHSSRLRPHHSKSGARAICNQRADGFEAHARAPRARGDRRGLIQLLDGWKTPLALRVPDELAEVLEYRPPPVPRVQARGCGSAPRAGCPPPPPLTDMGTRTGRA